MNMVWKTIKWSFLIVLVSLSVFISNLIWFKPFSIDHFYEKVFIGFALEQPQLLSSLGILESIGIKYHQDDLDDMSLAKSAKTYEQLKSDLLTLKSYQDEGLNESQKLSKDILVYFLEMESEAAKWQFHDYPVNQLFGLQSNFPSFMESTHRVNEWRDAEDYVVRMSKVDIQFSQALEGIRKRTELGVIPPKFVVEKVLREMRAFIAMPVEDNILLVSLSEKINKLAQVTPEQKLQLLAEAKSTFELNVKPAYQSLIQYFEHLAPLATEDAGVWKLPDGEAYYAYMLRKHTTTNMKADEIHQIGLVETDRIQQEMLTILASEGYDVTQGFDQAMSALNADTKFYYPDTEEGREQILKDYQSIIDDISVGLDDWFTLKPKTALQVQRIPQFKEQTSPGAYYQQPSMDGSRPGVFYANLYDIKATTKYGMKTLAYHEGVPGHHFQLALQTELQGLPMFRSVLPFTAYSEGWALYAEQLAWEAGFHAQATDNLGRLQGELFRAVRLVVDTGLHQKRWTREYAIDYMIANTGIAASDAVSEIERYIVNPGQATSYKAGMMKILALRNKAKVALGNKFDIKVFHSVVLENGSLPLSILERQVEQYISLKSK